MNDDQLLIANTVRSLIFLALAGLVVRRRLSLCWSFGAYLLAIVVGNSLVSFWPDHFWKLWFYVLKQDVYDVLKLAIAAEMAFRIFRAFPGALARARLVLAPLVSLVVLVLLWRAQQVDLEVAVVQHYPQAQTATIWLFTAMSLLAVWFHLPVHWFHRSVLLGFTSYQIVFVTLLNFMRSQGFEAAREVFSLLDGYAYLGLVMFWTWSAWRRYDPVSVPASAAIPLPEAARP